MSRKTKHRVTRIAILCTPLLLCESLSAQSGIEIMEEQERRHEADSEETHSVMKLISSRGTRQREMVTYTQGGEDGLSKSLLKFTAPADIRNVGLLTWEQPEDKDDDQWLYLPATRSPKRISGSSKKDLFMQSDLAFEDLRPENLGAHAYSVLREEEVDGAMCWVVEALPKTDKEKADSGYSKRLFWIRQDIYVTVKTEFYDPRERLSKLGTYSGFEQVEGDLWRPAEFRMEQLRRGTTTVWSFVDRQINRPIDKNLFTQQGLRRQPR